MQEAMSELESGLKVAKGFVPSTMVASAQIEAGKICVRLARWAEENSASETKKIREFYEQAQPRSMTNDLYHLPRPSRSRIL